MYEPHPHLEQPPNEAVKVWRYMDFTKLVSLIDSRCLFFARADQLGDPFEGSYPRSNVNARLASTEFLFKESLPVLPGLKASIQERNKQWPKQFAVNCWHMNEHESAAMWKLYLKSNEGIAVQSTYEKLRDSITDDEGVLLGIVKYIDYEKDSIMRGSFLVPFLHKRKSFEHERELRALVIKHRRETIINGLQIRIDVGRLIEKVHIAPSTPEWFADVVRRLIQRYGYKFEVVQSQLDAQPLF